MRNDRKSRNGFQERSSGSRFSERSESRGGFRGRSGGGRFRGDFEERDGFEERRGGRRFDRGSQGMHDVVCAKCGKDCQVPFKPTTDKPVFCNDCFRSTGGRNDAGPSSGPTQDQFKKLNAKLDKILEILNSLTVEEVEDEKE